MGGPMSIHDNERNPWLADEKNFISNAIQQNKKVLGICLGAQLIAHVLGASVHTNHCKEIGWFPVTKSHDIKHHALNSVLPQSFIGFHWHGETFDLPEQALLIGSSNICKQQGFIIGDRIIALQFHLETTIETAEKLIAHCANELSTYSSDEKHIQTTQQMLADKKLFTASNTLMTQLLDYLVSL